MLKTRVAILALTLSGLLSSAGQSQELENLAPPAKSDANALPLSTSQSAYPKPPSFAVQTARFQAEQRVLRMQWNKWIGHDPLRPTMNASYMSNGVQRYYLPNRSAIVSAYGGSYWYW